jgi:tellurite resistance protein TerC
VQHDTSTRWVILTVVITLLLAVDLFVHRGSRHHTRRSAIAWSIVWIAAGLAFNVYIWITSGAVAAEQYLAAYLIEKSLSLDNLFVFLVIFQALRVPRDVHKTALSWGIFGALGFRLLFIVVGVAALDRFGWVTYVFGAILFWAAFEAVRNDPAEQRESRLALWLSTHLPVSRATDGTRFFTRADGKLRATPLLVAVVAIELTDIVFAIDSVPAALSVSRDPFIVYASNAFAILGLRALYIVVAELLSHLRYLHYGLAGVLAFAATKLVLSKFLHIPPLLSVAIIAAMIAVAVIASVRAGPRPTALATPPGETEPSGTSGDGHSAPAQ